MAELPLRGYEEFQALSLICWFNVPYMIRLISLTLDRVPYYYVISRQTNGGRLRPVVNWVRKALIENVYRRLGVYPNSIVRRETLTRSSDDVSTDGELE